MEEKTKQSPRSIVFRQTIKAWIDNRRDEKLKGKDDPDLAAKYDYETWLDSAASRVSQIQAVTHVLKGTHPSAQGSSFYVMPQDLINHAEIGSHLLSVDVQEDITGNAAALDVYNLLKEEVEGKSLLYWAMEKDDDLEAALADDAAIAHERLEAFAGLVHGEDELASHPLAKQLYWLSGEDPTKNEEFHLLQPMFPSSLLQAVHDDIQEMRFGEGNKVARQARKKNEDCETDNHEYIDLVIRKLGSTKPQTVSQLNLMRHGYNYLLPSLPPGAWKANRQPRVLNVDSVLPGFWWFDDVRDQVKALADFLKKNPDAIMETRDKRKEMEQGLAQLFALYGATIRYQRMPGWSNDEDCLLPRCEQLWLDPERVELPDTDFEADFVWGDWPDEVASRFANWLNGQLRRLGVTLVGDVEHKHWARQAIIDADWPVPLQRQSTELAGEAS